MYFSSRGRKPRPIFNQIYPHVLNHNHEALRANSRPWKIRLINEGADDAGGAFDETISEMVSELQSATLPLLVRTPNSVSGVGFNTDRWVLNPACASDEHLEMFTFIGILFGVAIRTKKPLDFALALPMWKLLAGLTLNMSDIEEVSNWEGMCVCLPVCVSVCVCVFVCLCLFG